MSASSPAPVPIPRLCYAPPTKCPHPPHVWYGPDLQATHSADDTFIVAAWYCDGWAAARPSFIGQRP